MVTTPLRADVSLLSLSASWRYQQTANLDGINWSSLAYDDSAWPTGNALLYVETNTLVSPRATPLTLGRTTYYFRTHFNVPFAITNALVAFAARIDDGAVFYLNGAEIQRVRLPAAPTSVTYATLATGTPASGDATATETFTLSGADLTNVWAGDNVLAVEVHQDATNGDDIVFGTSVTWKFTNSAPVLVLQPTNVTVLDGRPTLLSALVDGDPPLALQWFREGDAIPNATNATLVLAAAYPSDGGRYWLAATNAFGSSTSTNAVLTVLEDPNPPVVLSALAQKNLTNIAIAFSEPILSATATLTNNYEVLQASLPSNHLDVRNVALAGNTGVVLTTSMRTPGLNYSLRVNGIQDISSVSNTIPTNSEVPLSYQVDLIAVDALTTWRYFQQGAQPATNWTSPSFDDSAWLQGRGVFAGGSPAPSSGDPVRTTLSLTAGTNAVKAYYFRTFFNLSGPLVPNSLRMHDIADDGAVFYLNGSEIFSVGMSGTRPVTYSTMSVRYVGTASYEPAPSSLGWSLSESNLTPLGDCFAAELHQNSFGMGDTAFAANVEAAITHYYPRPTVLVPFSVLEGAGTLTNQAQVSILEPLETNLVLQVSSTRPADVAVPSQITISAGATNALFDLVVGDDALFNGPRSVTLSVSHGSFPPSSAVIQVFDNETNSIQLLVASVVSENSGLLPSEICFSQSPSQPIAVALTSSDITEAVVPASVTMPAGATSVVFNASCVDDAFVDGPQPVTLSASVAGWPTAMTNITVLDNEPSNLVVTLPSSVVEGAGVLTNVGSVKLGAGAGTNFIIALTSSDPAAVGVPASVTIVAGQTNALFSLTVPDNSTPDLLRRVTVMAATPGLSPGSNALDLLDNDAHHIRFSSIGWLQTTGTAFGITLYAEDAAGNRLTSFAGSVALWAAGLEGALPIDLTNSGSFGSGQRSVSVRVMAPGTAVRLHSSPFLGESDAFNVGVPPIYAVSQPVADIAWHEASQTLFASVPSSGGVYSNQLVALDPASGEVRNAYPIGQNPGQIEISPDGQYLYAVLSNGIALRRFDLNTRQAGLAFGVDTNTDPIKTVYDFCILAGTSNSVVMMGLDNYLMSSVAGGVWRFDNGQRIELPNFSATGGWYLEALPTGPEILFSPPLVKGPAVAGGVVTNSPDSSGITVACRDGRIYDEAGNVLSVGTLARLGSYPDVGPGRPGNALAEVNSALRRVYYLSGYANYGTIFYKLKTYDRDLCQMLSVFDVPQTSGSPVRLVRRGTNGLAYTTANNLLWFIRPDVIESPRPPADLKLSLEAPTPLAVVGADYPVTLILSNAGPGFASIVRVTNTLPANVSVPYFAASTGNVVFTTAAFTWYVPALAPGSNATLNLTLRFGNAGWQTNVTYAFGFESDPVFTDNFIQFPVYVRLPRDGVGAFLHLTASEDLLYDPVRDRLLLSVGANPTGPSNGIAVFDPYNGIVDSFTPLQSRPGRLSRSEDGQFLYVSLPNDALLRRLSLTNLAPDLEFSLGGEYIYGVWYPFYAADLALMPGNPGSLAVWRMRRAGPMALEYGRGIALFDNGVMRSNVTASGGSWRVEFNPNTRTLFGFNNGDMRRCAVDAGGVTFVETYPTLLSSIGNDVEFAGNQFFTSSGRSLRTQPFGVTAIYPASERALLVEPDAASSRVFYLSVTNTTGWLQTYEMDSMNPRGFVVVSNILGTPSSLVRWGTNGLAFRTTSNQLFLVRTPLTQPAADADVRAALVPGSVTIAAGSNTLFTLTITNDGPGASGAIQVTNSFKPAASLASVTFTNGTCLTNAGNLVWSLGSLRAGEQSALSFALASSQTGVVTVISSAQPAAPDPVPQNNTAVATLKVGPASDAANAVVLNFAARDLIWSPAVGRLLMAGATNLANGDGALFSLNPVTLESRWEAQLGVGADRLKLAGDESRLYAALAYAVEERSWPAGVLQRRFLLEQFGRLQRAADLEVLPGLPAAVAAVRSDGVLANMVLGVWDAGTSRSNLASCPDTGRLDTGAGPERLYHLGPGGWGFQRFTVNAQGVSQLDADITLIPTSAGMDFVRGGGFLYASSGKVIDPEARKVIGTIAGIPSGALVAYDEPAARLFYLSTTSSNATLRAYDGPTLLPVGNLILPKVGGAAKRLVRWGADGFAFLLTASNQVCLFRTSLMPTNPPADVAVLIQQSAPPNISGSNLTATIVITNAGPNPATDVAWNNTLPAGATVVNASASTGSVATAANVVSGQMPFIPAGDSATVTVAYRVNAVGVFTNQVSAVASSMDPAFANNSATRLLWIQSPTGLPPALTLSLPLKDLARDPVRTLLYASFGSTAGALADSVVAIDPANGEIGNPVRVGSDPGRLAPSPDGQFLYVGLDGAGTVRKLALPSLTPVGSFAVPQNKVVSAMAVSPNDPNMVVIRSTPSARTSLHVGGVQRPGELTDQDLFAFSDLNGELFGCDGFHSAVRFYRLDQGTNGLALLDSQAGKQGGANLKSAGGWVFFDPGMVLDPQAKRVKAVMPVPGNSLVEPDVNVGRVFYLTPPGTGWSLRAFDLTQSVEVASVPVTGLSGTPGRLWRWGSDGFAISTSGGQLILLRGQLVPGSAPADLVLSQSAAPARVSTNGTVAFALLLTNRGPGTAQAIVVTQALSLTASNVIVNPAKGTASFANNAVTWTVGALGAGAVASLDVTLRPAQTGTLAATATARHEANDPSWANNTALAVVSVTNQTSASGYQLPLPTRELCYDPVRNLIYATLPASYPLAGNTVAGLDPVSGNLVQTRFAGSEPNQLALSRDARFLYTSLNGTMGVRSLDLQTGASVEWELGADDMFYVHDLKVHPERFETVAVSLWYNWADSYPSTVAIYDGTVARPVRGGPSSLLEFSRAGPWLFGYVPSGRGYGFLRMVMDASGILTNELFQSYSSDLGDMQFSGGRLWTASGAVLEPNVPVTLATVSAAGALAVDEAQGRAFYLAQKGANWELRAFRADTFQIVGTQAVANVQGTPGSLIRCGADRLAFRTSSNQVFIVPTALASAPVLADADLAVSQEAVQDFAAPAETLRFTITVTNRGGGNVSNALLVVNPPTPAASLSLQLSQGTGTNSGGSFLCNLGALAAGQAALATLSVVITNSLTFSNYASVSGDAPDPVATNNLCVAGLPGLFFQRTDTVRSFPLATRDLAYDQTRRRVIASVAGTNRLAWFDPETATLDGGIEVGGSPDKLAVSDDSRYLHVSFVNTSLMQRVQLPSRTVDLTYTAPLPTTPLALAALPGQPCALAMSCATLTNGITTIFDDGVARANGGVPQGFTLLTASTDGGFVFGYSAGGTGGDSPDVFRLRVSSNGLASVDTGPSDTPWGYNRDMTFSGGRLYFANGDVLNPATWTEETAFNVGWGQSVEVNDSAARIAHLMGDPYSATQLIISHLTTRTQLTTIDFGNLYQNVGSLVQCGADRHAFRSDSSLFFVRSSVIPSADLVLRVSVATNRFWVGETVSWQLIVSNAGPYSAAGVALTNTLPPGLQLTAATASHGTIRTNDRTVAVAIESLATNATATLTLTLLPTLQALGRATNTAEVSSGSPPDAVLFNNRVGLEMLVLPADADRDGQPDDWEIAHGLDPANPLDATVDSDCDGATNLQEYQAGTDPLRFDGLRLDSVQFDSQGQCVLTIRGAVGKTYTVETSTNFPHWSPLTTFLCRETTQRVNTPLSRNAASTFFRLRSDSSAPLPFLTLLNGPLLATPPPLLQVTASPGWRYSVQASTNLASWTEITNYVGVSCATVIADPAWSGQGRRFYRALRQ